MKRWMVLTVGLYGLCVLGMFLFGAFPLGGYRIFRRFSLFPGNASFLFRFRDTSFDACRRSSPFSLSPERFRTPPEATQPPDGGYPGFSSHGVAFFRISPFSGPSDLGRKAGGRVSLFLADPDLSGAFLDFLGIPLLPSSLGGKFRVLVLLDYLTSS